MKLKNRNRFLAIVCSFGLFAGGSIFRLTVQTGQIAAAQEPNVYLLKPARVFDGDADIGRRRPATFHAIEEVADVRDSAVVAG